MLELEDEIYEKILRLSKKGEQHLQEGLPDLLHFRQISENNPGMSKNCS